MKSSIIGTVSALILVCVFLIMGTLAMSSSLSNEVETSVNSAVYSAERTLYDQRDEIKSNDQYIATFKQQLQKEMISKKIESCKVDVYGVDYKKGLIDVKVTATYKNLYGGTKTVETRKTMIIDQSVESQRS